MRTVLTVTAVGAYVAHSSAWIVRHVRGGEAWPPVLEGTYLVTLVLWVSALALVHIDRLRKGQASTLPIVEDERTRTQFVRAHQIALVIVILTQIPFFVVDVPTKVLAQLTITTSVVALAAAYAWLDR